MKQPIEENAATRAAAAVRALCDVLRDENAALSAMDIKMANRKLPEKQAATDALVAALRGKPVLPHASRDDVATLDRLAAENRALLERAMSAQRRVIGCIARAVPRAIGQTRPYVASGRHQASAQIPPISLSAQI